MEVFSDERAVDALSPNELFAVFASVGVEMDKMVTSRDTINIVTPTPAMFDSDGHGKQIRVIESSDGTIIHVMLEMEPYLLADHDSNVDMQPHYEKWAEEHVDASFMDWMPAAMMAAHPYEDPNDMHMRYVRFALSSTLDDIVVLEGDTFDVEYEHAE